MKIGQYKQMHNHLTRPGTKEEAAKLEAKQKLDNAKRRAAKRKEYGLDTIVYDPNIDDTTPQIVNGDIKTVGQVKQDIKKECVFDGIQRRFDQQMYLEDQYKESDVVVKYNPDSGLYRNKIGTAAFRNAVDANRYNESVLGKVIEQPKPKQTVKPFIKKKTTAAAIPVSVPNINYEPIRIGLPPKTQEEIIREQNFQKLLDERKAQKIKNATQGLNSFRSYKLQQEDINNDD
jgi:hypothetical protein